MACKEENTFKQLVDRVDLASDYFITECEKSVKKIQWQIYDAKRKNRSALVRVLQDHLYESFCAKLLATRYAIDSVGGKELHLKRSFAPVLASESLHGLKANQNKHTEVSGNKEISSCKYKTLIQAPQNWDFDVARSLWFVSEVRDRDKRDCKNFILSETTNRLVENQTQNHSKEQVSKKRVNDSSFNLLEPAIKEKIREQAKQIHVLFILEPEWQAIFFESERKREKAQACFCKTLFCKTFTRKKTVSSKVENERILQQKDLFLSTCDKVMGAIKNRLTGGLPQYAFSVSVREHLHAIDHHLVIKQLNTSRVIEEHMIKWLKEDTLKTDRNLSVQSTCSLQKQTETSPLTEKIRTCVHGRQRRSKTSSMTYTDTLWTELMFQNGTKQRGLHSINQKDTPHLVTGCLLYSSFPQVLWKKHNLVYGSTPIERNVYRQKNHVITNLLSRVVLLGLSETMRQSAQDFAISNTEGTIGKVDPKKEKDLFCAIHLPADSLIMIHTNKRLLEACVLQGKRYLQGSLSCGQSGQDLCQTDVLQCGVCSSSKAKLCLQSKSLQQLSVKRQSFAHMNVQQQSFATVHTFEFIKGAGMFATRFSSNGKQSCNLFFSKKPFHDKNLICFCHTIKNGKKNNNKKVECLEYLFSKIFDCRQGFTLLGFQIVQVARQKSFFNFQNLWQESVVTRASVQASLAEHKASFASEHGVQPQLSSRKLGTTLYRCKIIPSKGSIKRLLLLIKDQIKQSQSASTTTWIARLNFLILQWVEYYKNCEYKHSYQKISYLVWEKTRPWLSRRKLRK